MKTKPKKKKLKAFILAVDGDDPAKELEFELDFQMSLTPRQRYRIMHSLVKAGQEFELRNGYQPTSEVVIRS
jgi:hypothetical protein